MKCEEVNELPGTGVVLTNVSLFVHVLPRTETRRRMFIVRMSGRRTVYQVTEIRYLIFTGIWYHGINTVCLTVCHWSY